MLVRWTPFSEMSRLQSEIDRLFTPTRAGAAATERSNVEAVWTPAFDVVEDTGKIVLTADLPGVDQQGLDIQVEHQVLLIKGERKLPRSAEAGGRYERVSGAFARSFRLPSTVDLEKIAASMKDGVLTLTLPKRAEAQPRQIKVNVQ